MNGTIVLQGDFFLENLYWITGLASLAFVGLLFLVDHLLSKKELQKEKVLHDGKTCILALGGEGNVVSKELEGSRITVVLRDYDCVNRDKLRDYGVSGFVKMSDRLVLVAKKDPADVYSKLFGSRP